MKGIAHFVTGVAIATFFPEMVQGAIQNLSFGPVLGGIAGLLPDTLDFKLIRYFSRRDADIDPAQILDKAGLPDPQVIAERIVGAIEQAYRSERPIHLQLHTVRLGADLWRRWTVTLDLKNNQVIVSIGPAVTTDGKPLAGSEIHGLEPGKAQSPIRILPVYEAEFWIDIFSGPTLAFQRVGDGVEVIFLPWHRAWTHSLLMVLILGALGCLIAPVYGVVMALAVLAHIVEDQMGFMGSGLFFPLTRKRVRGLGWFSSGDGTANFLTVWIGLSLIGLNLDRFSQGPLLPVLPYLLGMIVAPVLLLLGLRKGGDRLQQHRTLRRGRTVFTSSTLVGEWLDGTDEMDVEL